MNTSVIVILAVFVAFLALIGGAAAVGFIWFLVGLNKRLEAVVKAIEPLTGDGTIKAAMLSIIALANCLPEFITTGKSLNEAFSAFAAFAGATRVTEPAIHTPAPLGVVQPPMRKTPEPEGEFIPPPPDLDVIDEAMKDHLRKSGIELDPSRIAEPDASQINLAQV